MKLTPRQNDVLEFIQTHIADTGQAPTRAEIAGMFGMWPNQAQEIVEALRRKGFIATSTRKRRGIEVTAP
jgi:repressor LexA